MLSNRFDVEEVEYIFGRLEMAYWIFKIAEQDLYPDVIGEKYVYDNTHSIRVSKGDYFLYLDKRQRYSFTATGCVGKVTERKPTEKEAQRTDKVRTVYTALLTDVIFFDPPFTISSNTKEGKANRASLGIVDVNLLGWSQSMPSINPEMYDSVLSLCEIGGHIHGNTLTEDFSIPDNWSKTKTRRKLQGFKEPVLSRSNGCCIVCGTSALGLVDAAHISPYATDITNRANPANGICLCKYCHAAFDQRSIAILTNGALKISRLISQDSVASFHFTQVTQQKRQEWIDGVDMQFLSMTINWFNEKELQQIAMTTS